MAYGLRIKNSAGELQIDSIYRNLSYTQGGTVSVSLPVEQYWTPTLVNIDSSPLIPLILIRPSTDKFVTLIDYKKSGDNYTGFTLMGEYTGAGGFTSVDWRCYRETPSNPTGYGLRVKDASGNMIFNSLLNYFKIFSVHTISLNPWDGYQDITHAGINNPYYILSPTGMGVVAVWGIYEFKIGIKKISSTQIRVGWFNVYSEEWPYYERGQEIWNPTVKLIVCQI